ncbi:ribosomal-protein-alanine N-acetyltransferase [Paenibacillus taihuensis]|uniref:Ribosomal-protein-alanine N-acetyltransferase n=1 Tax=Paenibacillus taihuensis TaxID=1156355 RepID=A0A3D9SDH9_9BACL|nr:carbon-nitrogen hydrolase family protein [Paenibacillus taihuensis]REE89071.1 ribosomal-protein-alanine N-acetyltransferase [Paenibacillus taihuensis]
MRIGLAQTRFPSSLQDGLAAVTEMLAKGAQQQCDVICFPESILPGLRGVGYEVEPYDHERMTASIEQVRELAKRHGIAVILPTEWQDELGLHLVAFVISAEGELRGYQTKNQIDPDEDQFGYTAGAGRQIFELGGVKVGIVICHEGWRYPETVRWAALREASIVFHPHFTGAVSQPAFFQHTMMCRSNENQIFMASVNYALPDQGSGTVIIAPSGEQICASELGAEQLVVCDMHPEEATRRLPLRMRPELLV